MARPLRITYPGAFYHITSRGNERKAVFKTKRDREKFLEYLSSSAERYQSSIHTYCLMDNHYHLLLETPLGNLPEIMHHINGAYTVYFNRKRDRSGHLFQGRYKAILVEKDSYAKELSRYIHLNPVRAKMVAMPEDYVWSSYNFFVGLEKPPWWFSQGLILSYFGKKNEIAQKRYQEFVHSLIGTDYPSPLNDTVGAMLLGDSDFVNNIKENYIAGVPPDKERPALRMLAPKIQIDEVRSAVLKTIREKPQLTRDLQIYLCHRLTGEKQKDIGRHFGICESGVSHASKRVRVKICKNTKLKNQVDEVIKLLKDSRIKT